MVSSLQVTDGLLAQSELSALLTSLSRFPYSSLWELSTWETDPLWSPICVAVWSWNNILECYTTVVYPKKIWTLSTVMAQSWKRSSSKEMPVLLNSLDPPESENICANNLMEKLDSKTEDLTGRFLAPTYQRTNLKLISLLICAIMTHITTLDRNVQLSQLCLCIRTGQELMLSRKWQCKHQRESWATLLVVPLLPGLISKFKLTWMLF